MFFLLLLKVNFFATASTLTNADGVSLFLATLPIAIAGYISAIWQGKVAASGVGVLAKREEEVSKAIILAVMVETYAVLAFLDSFMMLQFYTLTG